MKKQFFTLFLLAFCYSSFATDRFVDLSGAGGAYFTIQSAVNDAVNGDRIIISTTGDFNENVNFSDKSLQFLPATEGERFRLKGFAIVFSTYNSFNVIIDGAQFLQGTGINALANQSGFNYSKLNNITVVNSVFDDGRCVINNCRGNFYNSKIPKGIFIPYGKIIGCFTGTITVTDVSRSIPEDTIFIVGNILTSTGVAGQTNLNTVNISNPNSYLFFSNNYVHGSGISISNLLLITNIKNSSAKASWIVNNSFDILFDSQTTGTLINIGNFNTVLKIYNNYFGKKDTENGIVAATNQPNLLDIEYNFFAFSAVNYLSTNIKIYSFEAHSTSNNFTYVGSQGEPGNIFDVTLINTGHPGNQFIDLDGSRSDIGTGGGSYAISQFSPSNISGLKSKVGFLQAPRVVHPGEKINIKVDGFDR